MTANGQLPEPPRFQLSRWLFLRLLGVVYLLAFASLTPQLPGLVGADGLLPAAEYLDRARDFFGPGAYWQFPTLAWINASDAALLALCWSGIALAVLAIAGVAPLPTFALLWLLYLSLTVAGQEFLSFQWDILLLEAGLLACLYAPPGWRPRLADAPEPVAAVRWLVWGLAFKLTFLSGVTKLVSGDPTWSGLTALTFHYQTQPLPAWTSWYAHSLPAWLHMGSAAVMFFIELVVPFGALAPARLRRVRLTACALMCLLQIGIAATGNYGFFGLLTVTLYLALLDDATLGRCLPGALARRAALVRFEESRAAWGVRTGLAAAIACLSLVTIWHEVTPRESHPAWSGSLMRAVSPLRSVNGYGLFRYMTTQRPEIVMEVSRDGAVWREQAFRWKPGALDGRPRFVQPHMPRLDWQMWFAALDPAGSEHWLQPLMDKLLAGSPAVTALLDASPLAAGPPRHVRLAYYRYDFTAPAAGRETGNWWRRRPMGYLMEASAP